MRKKLISLLMALAMVLSLVPTTVLAAGFDDDDFKVEIKQISTAATEGLEDTKTVSVEAVAKCWVSDEWVPASLTDATITYRHLTKANAVRLNTGDNDNWKSLESKAIVAEPFIENDRAYLPDGLYEFKLKGTASYSGYSASDDDIVFVWMGDEADYYEGFDLGDIATYGDQGWKSYRLPSPALGDVADDSPDYLDARYAPNFRMVEANKTNTYSSDGSRHYHLITKGYDAFTGSLTDLNGSNNYYLDAASYGGIGGIVAYRAVFYNIATLSDIHVYFTDDLFEKNNKDAEWTEVAAASVAQPAGVADNFKGITWDFGEYDANKMYNIDVGVPAGMDANAYRIKVEVSATKSATQWHWAGKYQGLAALSTNENDVGYQGELLKRYGSETYYPNGQPTDLTAAEWTLANYVLGDGTTGTAYRQSGNLMWNGYKYWGNDNSGTNSLTDYTGKPQNPVGVNRGYNAQLMNHGFATVTNLTAVDGILPLNNSKNADDKACDNYMKDNKYVYNFNCEDALTELSGCSTYDVVRYDDVFVNPTRLALNGKVNATDTSLARYYDSQSTYVAGPLCLTNVADDTVVSIPNLVWMKDKNHHEVTTQAIYDSGEGWVWIPKQVNNQLAKDKRADYLGDQAEDFAGCNVLVLNNFWMEYDDQVSVPPITLPAGTVVVLMGNNKLVPAERMGKTGEDQPAIYCQGDLTILGSDDATLTVKNGGNNTMYAGGIVANGDLTINANLNVETTSSALITYPLAGSIMADGKGVLTINGGTINAVSTADDAVSGYAGVVVNGGTVNAVATCTNCTAIHGGSFQDDVPADVVVNGGTVTATGGKYGICAGADTHETGDVYFNGGTVTATGDTAGVYAYNSVLTDETVTADFASVTSIGGNYGMLASAGKVNAKFSTATFKSTNNDGVKAQNGVTLVANDLVITTKDIGIHSENGDIDVTVTGTATITTNNPEGWDTPISAKKGSVTTNGVFVLNRGSVVRVEGANTWHSVGIYAKNNVTVNTGSVTVATACKDGIYAETGNITIYGDVTATQASDTAILANAGTVTIDSATVNVKGGKYGIWAKGNAEATGTNFVIIEGTASVTSLGTSEDGICAGSNGIEGNVYASGTNVAIYAQGGEYGIYATNNVNIEKASYVTAIGGGKHGICAEYNVYADVSDLTATGTYGIKAENGDVTLSTTNAEITETGGCSCAIEATNVTLNKGTFTLKTLWDGGSGINATENVTVADGVKVFVNTACKMGIEAKNVTVKGTVTVASFTDFGIRANEAVKFEGATVNVANFGMVPADLEKELTHRINSGNISINVGVVGATVEIIDSDVTAVGNRAGIVAKQGMATVTNLEGTKTVAAYGHRYGIYANSDIVINGNVTAEAFYKDEQYDRDNDMLGEEQAAGIYSKSSDVTVNGGKVLAKADLFATYTNVADREPGPAAVNVYGIYAKRDVVLNGGSVTATADGKRLDATDARHRFDAYGIYAESSVSNATGTKDVTIVATATNFGIFANHVGLDPNEGKVTLTAKATGDYRAIAGIYAAGAEAQVDSIAKMDVSGGRYGIYANTCVNLFGDADSVVTVTATKGTGIFAKGTDYDAGSPTMQANVGTLNVTGGRNGMVAKVGTVWIGSSDTPVVGDSYTVTGTKGCGIKALNGGVVVDDAKSLNVTGKIHGICASEAVKVTANTLTASATNVGIFAKNGNVSVEVAKASTITADGEAAILASASDVTVSGEGTLTLKNSDGAANSIVTASNTSLVKVEGIVKGNVDSANDAEVAGTVEGDVTAANAATVTNLVKGNVTAENTANVKNVTGTVTAGEVVVNGEVGGDATATATDVTVNASGSVAKNVTAAEDAVVNGEVKGNVTAGDDVVATAKIGGNVTAENEANVKDVTGTVTAGKVAVNGEVGGNVTATATDVTVNDNGKVTGAVTAADNAVVEGKVTGNVTAANNVGVAGEVTGNVTAGNIAGVSGTVTGNVTADVLNVIPGAKVNGGDVTANTMNVTGNSDKATVTANTVNVTGNVELSGKAYVNAKNMKVGGMTSDEPFYLNNCSEYDGYIYYGGYKFTKMGANTLSGISGEYLEISPNSTPYVPTYHGGGGGGGSSVVTTVTTSMPLLKMGSKEADAIKTLQTKLNSLGYNCGAVDGIFGSQTYNAVVAFQKANGLTVDGIVGSQTWGKLGVAGVSYVTTAPSAATSSVTATISSNMPLVKLGSRGDAVKALQTKLNALGYDCGAVDGIFGQKTLAAVKAYQTARGLGVDGVVGNQTWGALL